MTRAGFVSSSKGLLVDKAGSTVRDHMDTVALVFNTVLIGLVWVMHV